MSIKLRLIVSNIAMIFVPFLLMIFAVVLLFVTVIGPIIQPTLASIEYPEVQRLVESSENITPELTDKIMRTFDSGIETIIVQDNEIITTSVRNGDLEQLFISSRGEIPETLQRQKHLIQREFTTKGNQVITIIQRIDMGIIFSYSETTRARFGIFLVLSLVLFILILVSTSGFIIFLLSKNILGPLRQIDEGAEQIKNGNLDFEMTTNRKDEFGTVIKNFESMRQRLQNSIEHSLAEEESKKQMRAHISHDLRSPVTVIKGFSEVLLEGVVTDKVKQRQYLETIHNRAKDIEYLSDALLLHSKLDLGKAYFHIENVDIGGYLAEIIAEFQSEYETKGVTLIYWNLLDKRVELQIDREQLKRALNNLFENADKYRKSDVTQVDVRVTHIDDTVKIAVTDTGCGISSQDISRIFDDFYRVDQSRTHPSNGSGLGLSIAKQIVENLGGTISVESVEQHYTTFNIMLPIGLEENVDE